MIDEATGTRRVLLKLSGEAFGGGTAGRQPRRRQPDRRARSPRRSTDVEIADRRRRRQLLPRRRAQPARHGPRPRRLHGHARHRHERLALQDFLEQAGAATRVQSAISMTPGRRALHPAPRRAPHGEGPRRHLRRRRRTAVLLHRHRRRPARARDRRRRRAGRQERRRRRLHRRPAQGPDRDEDRPDHATSTRCSAASRSSTRPRSACAWTTAWPCACSAWSPRATSPARSSASRSARSSPPEDPDPAQ